MNESSGRIIVLAGVAIVFVGLLVWSGALRGFGRLPGDIRIERGSVHVYVPLVSMLLVSVVLSLIMYLVSRFR